MFYSAITCIPWTFFSIKFTLAPDAKLQRNKSNFPYPSPYRDLVYSLYICIYLTGFYRILYNPNQLKWHTNHEFIYPIFTRHQFHLLCWNWSITSKKINGRTKRYHWIISFFCGLSQWQNQILQHNTYKNCHPKKWQCRIYAFLSLDIDKFYEDPTPENLSLILVINRTLLPCF